MRTPCCAIAFVAMLLAGCQSSQHPASRPDTSATKTSDRPANPDAEPATQAEQHSPDSYSQGNQRRRDQRQGGARSATPGQFDYFLLTLSWSPEFCATHPGKPECAASPRFVVHGLWPENNDGSYPESCSNAPGPANPAAYRDIFPDAGLLRHEWSTHGTCSGMSADAYFSAIRRASRSVHIANQLQTVTQRISLTPGAIITGFVKANPGTAPSDYAVGCGNNYLTQVQICLNKNLQPQACQQVRSCRANVVNVVPPGGGS